MMYQRDINLISLRVLAEQAQQIFDDGRKEGVDAEEEEGERQRHDDHHDRGRDRFLAGRPVDLRGLGADLTDEFAGGGFGHVLSMLASRYKKAPQARWPAELTVT